LFEPSSKPRTPNRWAIYSQERQTWGDGMMEPETLIHSCIECGATLVPDGYQLRVKGWSKLTPELKEALRERKSEVLEHLKEEIAQSLASFTFAGLTVSEPHLPTTPDLLAWASELAEQDLRLTEPISYIETPLRTITTERVSYYAARYLWAISYSRTQQRTGGWGRFIPEWFRKQEEEALEALVALREALEKQGNPGKDGDE
jgi:hypothetical protein